MAISSEGYYKIDIKIRKYKVSYYDEILDPATKLDKPKVELMETQEKNSLDLAEALKHLIQLLS